MSPLLVSPIGVPIFSSSPFQVNSLSFQADIQGLVSWLMLCPCQVKFWPDLGPHIKYSPLHSYYNNKKFVKKILTSLHLRWNLHINDRTGKSKTNANSFKLQAVNYIMSQNKKKKSKKKTSFGWSFSTIYCRRAGALFSMWKLCIIDE